MRKIREVLRLSLEQGWSRREIAASVGIARSTVSEYLYRAEAAHLAWPLEHTDEQLSRLLFAEAGPQPVRATPDWAAVHAELQRKGVSLLLLWQEYKSRHPDGYGYSRFADLYNAWKSRTDFRMLQRHNPGEKLFLDFAGLTMPVTDSSTGAVSQVQVFCSAMGASHRIFACATGSQTLADWLSVIERAFEFYGALPQILVPDNLKAGVKLADRYEPEVNPTFAEFARFYDVAVLPARPRKPRDKAKVENGVQQTERWILAPLRDRTFFSLEDLNRAIALKLEELDHRIMKGPGQSRRELFEQVDLPAMRPLGSSRFAYALWKAAKVAPDYHVEFEGHRYSAPFALVGKRVDLRVSEDSVEIFHRGNRVCAHRRMLARRGFTTEPDHMPKCHRDFAQWTPERIESWAGKTGPNARKLVEGIMRSRAHPQTAFRSCMGVIQLEKDYGAERLEAACARAVHYGSFSRQAVKGILHKGLDREDLPELPAPAPLSHSNVRGAKYYGEQG